jgi:hypothetical protein
MNAPASASARPDPGKILLIVALVTLSAMALRTIATADYWQHLANGRAIAEHGIGTTDTLSLVSAGKAWPKPTWLYDVLMAKVHGGAGAGAVTLLHVAALAGAFTILARMAAAWAGATARGIAVLMVAWVLAAQLNAGPALFVLFIPALMLDRLQRHRGGWGLLAVLVPLQILWANLHPSFIVAPLLALATAVETLLAGRKDESLRPRLIPQFAAAAALLVAPLLNPGLAGVYGGGFAWLMGGEPSIAQGWTHPYLAAFSDEFVQRGGQLTNPVNWLLAAGAVGWVLYRQTMPVARTAVAFIGIAMVFNAYENAALLFGVLVLPFLTMSLQTIGNVLGELLAGGPGKSSPAGPATAGLFLALAAGTLVSFCTNGYYVNRGIPAAFGLGANLDLVPAEAMAVINRPDFPKVFVNLPLDGGYIAWKSEGRPVLIDGRQDLHPEEAYQTLMEGLLGRSEEATRKLFETRKPGAVVLNCGAHHAEDAAARLLASGSWAPAYFDGTTLILAQRVPENEMLLADAALQASGLALIEADRKAYAASLGGFRATPIPARLVGAGAMLMLRDQFKEALAVYNVLQAGAPTMVNASLQKGVCLLRLDKKDQAVKVLESARDLDPVRPDTWFRLSQAYEATGSKIEAKDALDRFKELTAATAKKTAS